MSKRIDLVISNALSLKVVNVHGAFNPLDMLTALPLNVHGAAHIENVHGAAALSPPNVHGAAHKIDCVHGACVLTLGQAQQVRRVAVQRGPGGELFITLHE